MRRGLLVTAVTSICIAGVVPPAAADPFAGSAPDAGRPFKVEVNSQPLYGIKPPSADPEVQEVRLETDGAELFMESYLPAAKEGNVPPEKVPTILTVTPYDLYNDQTKQDFPDEVGMASAMTLKRFVPHGYAYSQLHVRGTGESTGCRNQFTQQEADDIALAIEYLATGAPWSNGVVGGFGFSNPGGAILNAATRASERVAPYLKALVVSAPVVDVYNSSWIIDGVGSTLFKPVATPVLEAEWAALDSTTLQEEPGTWGERRTCFLDSREPWLQQSNDYSPYFKDRNLRSVINELQTPIFMSHGHTDYYQINGASPMNQVGLFEQIPATTPKLGIFGVFGHDYPSEGPERGRSIRPEWGRPDYEDMRIAWFDYWLKGIDSNIEEWPTVQVQGTDGQWRGEPDWPFTGGPVGHLALGPEGELGVSEPTGSTTYLEVAQETMKGRVEGTYTVFETVVENRLEITGQPVLDLWVELLRDDAHLAARIETFDAVGDPIPHGMTYGMRSAQHLDELNDNNYFEQEQSKPAPTGTPLNIQVRFQPTDLVVPPGGTIRVTVAGSILVSPGLNMAGAGDVDPLLGDWSQMSGTTAPVKILHDCDHPSALRFLMPREDPDLLSVREHDETNVHANPVPAPVSDGGGIATASVCGDVPGRLPNFGPERDYKAPGGGVVKGPR